MQIIGRGRGVNRTAADPLDVWVLTDVALPIPVEPIRNAELAPTAVDLMLAEGGIAFQSPKDASTAYPTLWETANAAKKAFQREVGVETVYKYNYTVPHLPLDLPPSRRWETSRHRARRREPPR